MLSKAVVAVPLVLAAGVGAVGAVGAEPEIARRNTQATPAPATGGYVPPLPGQLHVLRPFDPPSTPYGPGHLGVDLRAEPLELVRAAGAGIVRFAGQVAGRGVVVIGHADGIRTEYEPVQPSVHMGDRLRAGQPIGILRGRHRGCAGVCLHWGARRGDTYVDPLGLLQPLGPVVLLPWTRRG
jgi:murein DD-endopeptidase MepM/ murein hydrolase activator NlpD